MARKLGKKKRQELLDELLVELMKDTHNDYLRFVEEYSIKLESKFNEVALLKASSTISIIVRNRQIAQATSELLTILYEYQEAFRTKLSDTMSVVMEEVLGQDYLERVIYTAEDNTAIVGAIEGAYDYFEEIFSPILLQLTMLDSTSMLSETQENELVATLITMRDRLSYELRRHVEAQMSLIVNLGIIEASKELYGISLWKWSNRPELTESGTCAHCKSLAEGGIGSEGIYTLETLPLLPVHPHCVCVVLPVIP